MSTGTDAGSTADVMDKGAAASGADAFDAATGTSMTWDGKRPEELAALPESELSSMSHEDIEKAFGLDIPDRTRQIHPTGALTVNETERALEAGEVSVPTEEMLAAAALEVLSPPGKDDKGEGAAPAAAAANAPEPAKAGTADPASAGGEGTGAAPAQQETTDERPVVATRDGKGVIPYDVLEAARRRTAELEAELAAERGAKQRKQEQDQLLAGLLTDEQIQEMRNEFPEAMVNAIVAQQNTLRELAKKISEQPRAAGDDDLTPEQKAAQAVQDLIDQDPVLSKWQNDKDQSNWNRAVHFDEMLRQDPVWQTKPVQDRLDEVRRLMGEPRQAAAPAGGQTTAQQVATAAAAAEAAARASAAGRAPTHSDLPGGSPPAQSEQSRLESLTPTQLEAMLENGVEVDALLARFG